MNAEIEQALTAAESGVYLSLSRSPDVVEVDLRADQATLAAQLVEDYGDTVAMGSATSPTPCRPISTRSSSPHATGPRSSDRPTSTGYVPRWC